jgi:hypothetical protein
VARRAAAVEREGRALDEYLSGGTFEQAARAAGYADRSSARRAILRALAARAAERSLETGHAVTVHLGRLERLLRAWLPRAEQGDPAALVSVLQILDRIARVTGTEQPGRLAVAVQVENSLPDREAATASVLAGLAATAAKLVAIDGQLHGAGTSVEALTGQAEYDARPMPPPLEGTHPRSHA